jgi:2-amino-4-hydroxy-6-hydroxymethyldihydropteridine diphosphokinase
MRTYLGLGSNLGERKKNIENALGALREDINISKLKVSSFYETEPIGGPPQGLFINAVAECFYSSSASDLLSLIEKIENKLLRTREGKNSPRTIDIDILLFGEEVYDTPKLKIPHPRIKQRLFVLLPLSEFLPEYRTYALDLQKH